MERIGDEVRKTLGRFGPSGAMAEVVEAWPGAVGEVVAANAWPARLSRDGTLHVATSSSAWAFELSQLEADVLRCLREVVGDKGPGRLRFAPGPLPEVRAEGATRPDRALPEPTLEQVREARSLAAGIESEELRKTVEKAARTSFARASTDRAV